MSGFIPTVRPTGRCFGSRSKTERSNDSKNDSLREVSFRPLWEARVSNPYYSIAAISKEEVQASYEEFLRALKSGDVASLERIYPDDYLLGVNPYFETAFEARLLRSMITSELLTTRKLQMFALPPLAFS